MDAALELIEGRIDKVIVSPDSSDADDFEAARESGISEETQ